MSKLQYLRVFIGYLVNFKSNFGLTKTKSSRILLFF
jgi:hypothetical protein